MPTPYNMAFACLKCRKSFKREATANELTCPECGGVAYNFGRHFKAPRKADLHQWKKITFLFEHGFGFQKIRPFENSLESIPYPATLEEAKEFVAKYKDHAIE